MKTGKTRAFDASRWMFVLLLIPFLAPASGLADEVPPEIESFLTAAKSAVRQGRMADLIDAEGMLGSLAERKLLRRVPSKDSNRAASIIKECAFGMSTFFSGRIAPVKFVQDKGHDRGTLVLVRRFDGEVEHHRWSLRKREGRWTVFDWEDVESGLPASFVHLINLVGTDRKSSEIAGIDTLVKAKMALFVVGEMVDPGFERTRLQLKKLARKDRRFSTRARALRAFYQARLLIWDGEDKRAGELLEEASKADPTLSVVDLIRADNANDRGEYVESERFARSFLAQNPSHSGGETELAISLYERDRVGEALEASERACEADPQSVHSLVVWLLMLPEPKEQELKKRLMRFSDQWSLSLCLDALIGKQIGWAIPHAVAVHEKRFPGDSRPGGPFDVYRCEVDWVRKDYAEALKGFSELRGSLFGRGDSESSENLDRLYHLEDRIVRCLVYLGQLNLALTEAQKIARRDRDFLYVALVNGARGEIDQLKKTLKKAKPSVRSASSILEDDQLRGFLEGSDLAELGSIFEKKG